MPTKLTNNPIQDTLYLPYEAADAQTANARTKEEYDWAAEHHAARAEQARAARNGQAAARHHATMLCCAIAARIRAEQPNNAAALLDGLVKHISTLHVQTRYARRTGKPLGEITDRDNATKHYQALQSALRKAAKGGEMPVIRHYGAIQMLAPIEGPKPQPAPEETPVADAPGDEAEPQTQEPDPEALLAYHTRRAADHLSPEGRELHKTLVSAYKALLGHNAAQKPHKGNARARLEAAHKKHGGFILNSTDEMLGQSLAYLTAALAKGGKA